MRAALEALLDKHGLDGGAGGWMQAWAWACGCLVALQVVQDVRFRSGWGQGAGGCTGGGGCESSAAAQARSTCRMRSVSSGCANTAPTVGNLTTPRPGEREISKARAALQVGAAAGRRWGDFGSARPACASLPQHTSPVDFSCPLCLASGSIQSPMTSHSHHHHCPNAMTSAAGAA